MTAFDINTELVDGTVVLGLAGELDISTGPELTEELERVQAEAPATVVIDLRRLEFLDSSGLRVLIAADDRAREAGTRLVIVKGPDVVSRVFEVTRLDERFELVDEPPAPAGAG
jgi:anti-sigma B factor antagonist